MRRAGTTRSVPPALVAGLAVALLLGLVTAAALPWREWHDPVAWQRLASPGPLSAAHASLEKDCAACHTSVKGVDSARCISCHATNEALLQRQPTAFHAEVRECRPCHTEHQGAERPTLMDHAALANLGLRRLRESDPPAAGRVQEQLRRHGSSGGLATDHPRVSAFEATLDCSSCHSNQDRHRGLFGTECASCHATSAWTISEFRHPSPRSTDCAQCHQAPPSHYREHFKMVSARVARQPKAKVSQCYQCHQTTSWNDIRGVGWYKHH